MIHVFLICLACCCSSLMPLKYSESIMSEDHTQVVAAKCKRNYLGGDDVNYFTASDFTANSFGEVFYKEIGDLQAPATSNLPYTARTTNTIEYNYESDSVFGWALQGGFGNNLLNLSDYLSIQDASISNNTIIFDSTTNTGYDDIQLQVYNNGNYVDYLGTFTRNDTSSISFTKSSSFNELLICRNGNANLYKVLYDISNLDNGKTYTISLFVNYINYYSVVTLSNIMLNVGYSSKPYQPFFIGGYPSTNISFAIRFLDIKKEYVSNPNNNTYMYHYTMDFSASRPGAGKTRIFSVITDIMPEIKRVDTQGNLWPGGFWSYTYIDLNPIYYDIPLNSFMYGESSATGQLAPILNKYIRNLTYGDSYQGGYDAGYDNGYNIGNNYGYQRGYSEGIAYAQEQSSTALTIFTGIIEVGLLPVNVFLKMFEYEVFGINIAGLVSGLITIAMIMILLRFIFGGKQNGK